MTLKGLNRRRTVAAGAAIAVVAAGGVVVWSRHGSSAAATTYRTAAATLGTVTQSLALTGNLASLGASNLNFGSSGRVTAVNVQPGQSVTSGQVLATIDPNALQAALDQATAKLASDQASLSLAQAGPSSSQLEQSQAQVRTAQANLASAQQQYSDTVQVNAQKVSSGQETALQAKQSNDQADAQVTSAQVSLTNAQDSLSALESSTTSQQVQMDQSQVQIDQIAVTNAQQSLQEATITAPAAGVVGVVNLTVGQQVQGVSSTASTNSNSSSSSSSSSPEISVLTPGAFEVTGTVSDTQVNEVAVGQQALVTPAGSTQAIQGKVTQIAPEATITSGVATFPVTIVLTGSNPSLHAGVAASITLITEQLNEVVTVPTSAVRGNTVQELVNGTPQSVPVTVGLSDATLTQIESGVNVGQQVVIATVSSSVPASGTTGAGAGGFAGAAGRRGGAGSIAGALAG